MNSKSLNNQKSGKLGLIALIAIVVSSMIGAGIDALPQNMAQNSAILPVLISWCVAGAGMFFIAKTYILLNELHPELKNGIYGYASIGFGNLTAFFVGWGYWLMCIFSNVAYGVMLMSALDYFMPGTFNDGSNLSSIIGITLLIWGFNQLVLTGIRDASLVNIVGTFAKLIPLVFFVFIVVYFMRVNELDIDLWGESMTPKKTIYNQIKDPLDIALWCFIGIEGAVVLSGRAKKTTDISKATLIGFLISLILCILVSILPFGVMTQSALSQVQTPSTAGIAKILLGEWGELFISIGVVISVLSAWLAWTMLCAEIPMTAANYGTFPKIFKKFNKKEAPSVSVSVSSLVMQLALVLVYFSSDAWVTLLDISALLVLPAYLTSTLFLLKLTYSGDIKKTGKKPLMACVTSVIGAVFCLFMFCTSNLNYLLMIPVFLTVGIPIYMYARVENKAFQNQRIFSRKEICFLLCLILFDALALSYVSF